MSVSKTPEQQADYRRRKAAGLVEAKRDPLLERAVVPLTDDERHELEVRAMDVVQATLAAWLLGQRSRNTAVTYRRAWQAWVDWCTVNDESWLEPRRGVGAVWVASMNAERLSPATVRLRMAAVRSGLLELSLEGMRMGADPFLRVKAPRVADVSSTIPLSDDQVHRAVEAARALGGHQLTTVLALAVMGLRASEVAQLSVHTVKPSPWGMVADIVGKGQKAALVPVPEVVLAAARIAGWPCDEGNAANRRRVTYMVAQVSEAVGFKVHPHQFRHWHATVALREGVPIERVQDSLRHESPTTTQRYNRARVVVEGHSAFTIAEVLGRPAACTGVYPSGVPEGWSAP